MRAGRIAAGLIAAVLALLAGCRPKPVQQSLSFFAMDTVMTITAYADDEILSACAGRVEEIDGILSALNPDSQISRLNRDGVLAGADPMTIEVVGRGKAYGEELGGAFDISIRPVSALWDIKGKDPKVPTNERIETARALVDYKKIIIEDDKILIEPGMGIDLGGIAKGYAADEILRILKENGVNSGFFSLGGNVGLCGSKPDGSDWKVGIRDPHGTPAEYMGVLSLSDTFVVTSGGYERFFEQDGVVYHHIFDPATGRPAGVSLVSVTIVCDNSARADALSTALYVMDFERAVEFYRASSGFEMVLIDRDGGVYISPGLEGSFTLTNIENYRLVKAN